MDNYAEPATGEVIGSAYLPAGAAADQVSEDDIKAYAEQNGKAFRECYDYMNGRYMDNASELMGPALKEMRSAGLLSEGMPRDEAREAFRNYVHKKYMGEFNELYDSHPDRVASNNLKVESLSRAGLSKAIRNTAFSRDNPYSFVSDAALDGADWCDI